ncbi:hypothetical protein BGZ60DRAFT_431292 [Tricladium varicosporioides]|nr:hypothetical protein BGZ60DRAFT_431292 [Hymenoscyphus varicosporioides]
MPFPDTVFCCPSAIPIRTSRDTKPYHDPNRELHDTIFGSFLTYAIKKQRAADLLALILRIEPELNVPPPSTASLSSPPRTTAPILTAEALANNPLTPHTPYVIHLTSRRDYGPVYSHRYFACPLSLKGDWIEISHVQWFAEGEPFRMKAEKWDLKCLEHSAFFRMTLRPNLALRYSRQVIINDIVSQASSSPEGMVVGEGTEHPCPAHGSSASSGA